MDVIGTLIVFYQLAFYVVRFAFLLLAVSFLLDELLLVSFVLPRGSWYIGLCTVGLTMVWYVALFHVLRLFSIFGWVLVPYRCVGLVVFQSGSWSN